MMNSNRKRSIIIAVIFSVVLISGVFIVLIVRDNRDTVEWRYFDGETNMDSIVHVETSLLNEEDIVFIVNTNIDQHIRYRHYLSGHYILGRIFIGRMNDEDNILEVEQLDHIIYDLVSGEPVRTVNFLEIMEEFGEISDEFQIVDPIPSVYGIGTENFYFEWRISENSWDERNSENVVYKYILMNYGTGEISLHDESQRSGLAFTENEGELARQISVFDDFRMGSSLESFYLNNGIIRNEHRDFSISQLVTRYFIPSVTIPSIVIVTLSPDNLPMESESLYSRFPGLREFQGEDGFEINIVLTGYPTAEEVFELFMEDGHEVVFDGLVMRGGMSIDGEEHEINSFEDYFRLRDFSWLDEEEQSDNDGLD